MMMMDILVFDTTIFVNLFFLGVVCWNIVFFALSYLLLKRRREVFVICCADLEFKSNGLFSRRRNCFVLEYDRVASIIDAENDTKVYTVSKYGENVCWVVKDCNRSFQERLNEKVFRGGKFDFKKITVIVNPCSGKSGSSSNALQELLSILNIKGAKIPSEDFSVVHTTHRGHAYELGLNASSENNEYLYILVGGDGLLHEFANGLGSRKMNEPSPILAIVPAGSGNGVAKSLGFEMNSIDIGLRILQGNRWMTGFDALYVQFKGKCKSKQGKKVQHVLSLASVNHGIIADVDHDSERFRFLGSLRFHIESFIKICTFQQTTIKVNIESCCQKYKNIDSGLKFTAPKRITRKVTLYNLITANVPFISHDMKFTPSASHNDGFCDVGGLLRSTSRFALLFDVFLKVEDGSFANTRTFLKHGFYHKANSVDIELLVSPSEKETLNGKLIDIDGEFFYASGTVCISPIKKRFQFISNHCLS